MTLLAYILLNFPLIFFTVHGPGVDVTQSLPWVTSSNLGISTFCGRNTVQVRIQWYRMVPDFILAEPYSQNSEQCFASRAHLQLKQFSAGLPIADLCHLKWIRI